MYSEATQSPLLVALPIRGAAFRCQRRNMLDTSPKRASKRTTPIMMGVVVVLVALLVMVGLVLELSGRTALERSQDARTLLVQQSTVNTLLVDMEIALRGYIITGNESFLEPYNSAQPSLPLAWQELIALAASHDQQEERARAPILPIVEDARDKAQTWRREIAEPEIAFIRSGRAEEAVKMVATGRGRSLFDDVRSDNARVGLLVSERIVEYTRALNNVRQLELWMLLVLGTLTLGTGMATARLSQREARLQYAATSAAKADTERLETVLEHLPIAVRLLSQPRADCIIQNHAASLLFPKEKWNSLSPEERINYFGLVRPDGTVQTIEDAPVMTTLRQGVPVIGYEFLMNSPETGTKHLIGSTAPLKDADGQVNAAVVVIQDVTHMKELDRRKDEFIATAAHELRNPLAALSGYNQLLQRSIKKIDAPDSVRRQLGEMGTQITRLARLVDHLLDASRIQLGRLVLKTQPTDVSEVARMVATSTQTSLSGFQQVEVTSSGDTICVCDQTRIEQVITNLLSNALRFSPPDKPVRINVQGIDGKVRVDVIDHGPGIAPEQRANLFTSSHLTGTLAGGTALPDASSIHTRGTHKGLGLGLHISNEIVKAHQGEIGVEPNPVGGSVFWFTLPFKPA